MSRLDPGTYADHVRAESRRFAQVLADCDPGARVPSCPDWDAADLLWHLGTVQHFWHHVLATRPAAPEAYEEPERPASYGELLEFFDHWHGRFHAALVAADPADPAWSWSPRAEHQSVGFTHRRQAHEALIHRLDAELTAGAVTPLPTDLAADGVEEALDVMYGAEPPWGRFTASPHLVEYRISDTGSSVWARLGTLSGTSPEGVEHVDVPDQHVVVAPGRAADLVVSGTAERLDGWLWHRLDATGVTIEGDPEVRRRVAAVLEQPID